MRTCINGLILLVSAVCVLGAETDFPSQTGDPSVLLVKRKGPANEVAAFHRANGGRVTRFKHIPWDAVEVRGKSMAHYKASPLFEKVEVSRIYKTCAVPNDPLYTNLWGHTKIAAPLAWDTRTSNDVVVAVIDTGIDFDHPDLQANLWTGPSGEHGYTALGGIVSVGGKDDHYHGTHVAGTIGAVGNNALGVAGLNWRCKLLALKFLGSGGSGNSRDAALIIERMVELKLSGVNIRVSNNSWGGRGNDEMLKEAFRVAEEAGIINICAAGNDGADIDNATFTPAGYDLDGIIAVIASDHSDEKASFSNFGLLNTDLLAPGVSILSCRLGGSYWELNGTSMASPHVAGVAAMMFSFRPDMTVSQCRSVLMDKDSLDQTTVTQNTTLGGRLNMAKAVNNPKLHNLALNTNLPPVLTLSATTNLLVLAPGAVATITATATDPNGDTLSFATKTTARHQDGWLLSAAMGTPPVFASTNTITITNKPSAVALNVRCTFFVSDGHGGAAAKVINVFMEPDYSKVRSLSTRITGASAELITNGHPAANITLLGDVPSDVKFSVKVFTASGATRYCCGSAANSQFVYLHPGLNIVHVYACDSFGNFYDLPHLLIGESLYPQYPPPLVKLTVDKVSGPSPLAVTVDMSPTDIYGTNNYLYTRDYWHAFGSDFDFRPQKTFTLSEPGLHPMEFDAFDGREDNNIWDEGVILFQVFPPDAPQPIQLFILRDPVLCLQVRSEPGRFMTVEQSSNLRTWSTFQLFTNRNGYTQVPLLGAEAQSFYRARQ